jgi:hypothetical protein
MNNRKNIIEIFWNMALREFSGNILVAIHKKPIVEKNAKSTGRLFMECLESIRIPAKSSVTAVKTRKEAPSKNRIDGFSVAIDIIALNLDLGIILPLYSCLQLA